MKNKQQPRFVEMLEQYIEDHPKVGAVVLDGVIVACHSLGEMLDDFAAQLVEKSKRMRGSDDEKETHRNYRQH